MTAVWVWLFLSPDLQTHFSRQEKKKNMADKGRATGIASETTAWYDVRTALSTLVNSCPIY